MASQQSIMNEVILGFRKAYKRVDDDSESDDSIVLATNRGNKLKRKAKFVQEGRLDNPNGPATRKKRIRYAGYDRSIVYRNPPRFDDYGDIIETDDDEDYDARDNEDNIYKDTKIEVVLGPLTAATDLSTHPGLSIPYKSAALQDMVTAAEESLHNEKETLWRMKHLLINLRGDSDWVPTGAVQSDYDDWLLNTIANGDDDEQPDVMALIWGPIANGSAQRSSKPQADSTANPGKMDVDTRAETVDGATKTAAQAVNGKLSDPAAINGVAPNVASDDPAATAMATGPTTNGTAEDDSKVTDTANGEAQGDAEMEDATGADGDDETGSQPPSHRMTTRARAHRTSRSPSASASTASRTVHPFFEFNQSAIPGFDAGLPSNEASDVRAFLVSYVSKQEEVVRGLQQLYDGLLRALQMRKTVWKWCRAEGHVGEMSDGEDWYDKEEWGLDEDLVKGKEEEDEEVTNQKKTRRRGER